MEKMKIAELAPVAMPVRPGEGDSIEQLVSLLTEELVRRGHDVTLFAVGDSVTTAELRSCYAHGYRENVTSFGTGAFPESLNAAWAFEHAGDFDVSTATATTSRCRSPASFRPPSSTPTTSSSAPRCLRASGDIRRRIWLRSRTSSAASSKVCDHVPVIHNGIDAAAFPFRAERGEYLAFLGRMIPSKGAAEAVRVARTLEIPLIMAGPSTDWFERDMRSAVDDRLIRYVGTVDAAGRNELLAGAAALLYPITYPEPFGLVMVEAMACGTPVAAFGVGAVPEIVEQGVGGSWVSPGEDLGEAVQSAVQLDRRGVRQAAVERFDYRRMVDAYERLYRRLAEHTR